MDKNKKCYKFMVLWEGGFEGKKLSKSGKNYFLSQFKKEKNLFFKVF
jgi:hypothetical protein